jgi:Tfp pilus assembly PilM family ATPase
MIDDRFIRFFQVEKNNKKYSVKKYFSERIPDEFFDRENNLINHPTFIDRLRLIRTQHHFHTIHMVIPDRYVTVFHTIIPITPQRKKPLRKHIEQSLQKLLQDHPEFSPQDMVSDYHIINTDHQGIHMHVAVARPERFAQSMEAITSAGFVIDHIDIASFAVHRIARHMNAADSYGIISLGTHATSTSIVLSGKITASAWSPIGSNDLIESIEKTLNISSDASEKIIQEYGILHAHPDKRVLSNLLQTIQPIATDIDNLMMTCSMETYRHDFYHHAPQQWYLYGVGASIPGIAQYLGIRSHTQVHTIDIIPTEFIDEQLLLQIPIEIIPLYLPVLSTAMNYLFE